jgi:hypothetical protein
MTSFNIKKHFEMLLLAMVLAGSGCSNNEDGNQSNSNDNNDDQYDGGDDQDVDGSKDANVATGGNGEAGSAGQEQGGGGQAGGTGGDTIEAYGFSIRVPQYRTVSCQTEMGTTESAQELEVDLLCTFVYAGESGHIYLRSKPAGCKFLMGPVVTFELESAQLALGDDIIALENAVYDRGGNHMNDSFEFDYQQQHFKYYHSSFGFGFRACQPMDCIQVFNSSADDDPVQDGCTAERTLPVVCIEVQEDGSFDELEDSFAPCPGDPNTEQPQG